MRSKLMKTRLLKIWNFLFAFWLKILTLCSYLLCYSSGDTVTVSSCPGHLVKMIVCCGKRWQLSQRPQFLCPGFVLWCLIQIGLLHLPSFFKFLRKLTGVFQTDILLISMFNNYIAMTSFSPEETSLQKSAQRFPCNVRTKFTFNNFNLVLKLFEASALHLLSKHKYEKYAKMRLRTDWCFLYRHVQRKCVLPIPNVCARSWLWCGRVKYFYYVCTCPQNEIGFYSKAYTQ